MMSSDLVRIARNRAGLSQDQLSRRLGQPRSTLARWESGTHEPSLKDVQALVRACGLELTLSLSEADSSLDALVTDQLALAPAARVRHLLGSGEGAGAIQTLEWLAGSPEDVIVIGAIGSALLGGPQRPGSEAVEFVPDDLLAFTDCAAAAGWEPVDNPERFDDADRRWEWRHQDGGRIEIAGALQGAPKGFQDLRRQAVLIDLDVGSVEVACPRDLLRIAEASRRPTDRAHLPGLRALLRHGEGLRATSSPA